jgi:predicted nucleotidyltransferase component of viral defense system
VNSAASIRARLLNESKKSGESFQSLLVRFASERFLFRLGKSDHRDAFLLKGAMLFVAWGGRPHRPTKDLDLLGFGEPGQEAVARRIADIAALSGEDGIEFDIDSIVTELIKEDAEYEGVRVHLTARLEQARVRLQIDSGFGDAVTPEPIAIHFPTILDRVEAPFLRIYPPEVVIAEKLHAMIVLDIRNSRMKDFYDIWFLARTRSFDLAALTAAITATFERRRTPLPAALPFALTTAFLEDAGKVQQWSGFVRRLQLDPETPALAAVGNEIAEFVRPLFIAPSSLRAWQAGGPWL